MLKSINWTHELTDLNQLKILRICNNKRINCCDFDLAWKTLYNDLPYNYFYLSATDNQDFSVRFTLNSVYSNAEETFFFDNQIREFSRSQSYANTICLVLDLLKQDIAQHCRNNLTSTSIKYIDLQIFFNKK